MVCLMMSGTGTSGFVSPMPKSYSTVPAARSASAVSLMASVGDSLYEPARGSQHPCRLPDKAAAEAHGVFCAQSFIVSAAAAVETTCDATWLSTVRARECIAPADRERSSAPPYGAMLSEPGAVDQRLPRATGPAHSVTWESFMRRRRCTAARGCAYRYCLYINCLYILIQNGGADDGGAPAWGRCGVRRVG